LIQGTILATSLSFTLAQSTDPNSENCVNPSAASGPNERDRPKHKHYKKLE
jgi:hypothetical protein